MDEGPKKGLQAMAEAEWLRELFENCALQAAERRIAYSIDRHNIAGAMFFLDVYRYVNGGDILLPKAPASHIAARGASGRTSSAGGPEITQDGEIGTGPHFNQREAQSRSPAND